jgi:CBS domain-containing protein
MYGRTVQAGQARSGARSVMRWPVATVENVASLHEVAECLAADEVGALCVVEGGALAGIVSERDVVTHLAAGGDPAHLTAGEVMTSDLLTIAEDTSLLDAARMMQEGEVRHLPVLAGGHIVGMVSMRDVFAALLDSADTGVVPVTD